MAKKDKKIRPFHLAFPVSNLDICKKWYTEILGCSIGRKSKDWIDFNLFGHQIVAHLSDENYIKNTNLVDNQNIPVRHFGVILKINQWDELFWPYCDKGFFKLKKKIKPNLDILLNSA